jgi:uncharacterized protein (DUF2236 family)
MADVEDHGELLVTDNARRVADLFLGPPHEAEWRPVLAGVSRLAFATLPPLVREMYGFPLGPVRQASVDAAFAVTRVARPFLPAKFRYLAPYDMWRRRQRGEVVPDQVGEARRSLGIRLGG